MVSMLRKILVVDDEEAVRLVTVEMLNRMGFRASAADGGGEALERVVDEAFDLVLLDVAMPVMSGADTFAALRQILPDLPVLFMTGYAKDDINQLLNEQDITDVLPKPFPMAELKQAVERMLLAA